MGKKIKEDIEAEQSSSSDALKEIAQWIAGRIGNCIVRDSTVFYIMEDFEIYDFEDWSKTYEIDKGIFFIIEVEPKNIKISWPYFDKAPLWKEIDNHPVDFFTENKSETCHSIKDLILIIDDYMGRDWFGAEDEEVELYDEMFKSIGKDNVDEDIEAEVNDDIVNDIPNEWVVRGGGSHYYINGLETKDFIKEHLNEKRWYFSGSVETTTGLYRVYTGVYNGSRYTSSRFPKDMSYLNGFMTFKDLYKKLIEFKVPQGIKKIYLEPSYFSPDGMWNVEVLSASFDSDVVLEDIEDEVDDAGYIDIESLLEDEGIEAFSPENIEKLKSLGQIDANGNLMDIFIEPDIEDVETSVWDLERLHKLDYKLIEADYVKQLLINEVKRGLGNSEGLMRIDFKTNDLDVKNYSELSQDFVEKCFEGDVYGELGYDYETDISYIDEDLLRSEKIDRLFSVNGLPEDSLILVKNGEVDEDENPRLAKYAEELENAMRLACTYAEESGAEEACLEDFDAAFNESVPDRCSWNERLSDNEERCIEIDESFIVENIKEIWDAFDDYYSSDAADNAERIIKELINIGIGENFREPYSGWYGFSNDTFIDCLMDNLYEINFDEEEPQEEENLLNFNGNTGEYEEDLEEDIEAITADQAQPIEKKKNIYYKYFEYNKELSAKSYRLTGEHILILAEWAKDNDAELYEELDGSYYLDDNMESDAFIIMSKIKPSYSDTYTYKDGYTLWGDDYFYEPQYLGEIPKEVGDKLIKGKSLAEELAVCCVPADFPYDDILVDNNALETLLQQDVDNNAWGAVDSDTGELITDVDTFGAAWQLAKHIKGTILFVYLPNDDTDLDIKETEDKIQFVPIALIQNEK